MVRGISLGLNKRWENKQWVEGCNNERKNEREEKYEIVKTLLTRGQIIKYLCRQVRTIEIKQIFMEDNRLLFQIVIISTRILTGLTGLSPVRIKKF